MIEKRVEGSDALVAPVFVKEFDDEKMKKNVIIEVVKEIVSTNDDHDDVEGTIK